jgi:hypothetical protein
MKISAKGLVNLRRLLGFETKASQDDPNLASKIYAAMKSPPAPSAATSRVASAPSHPRTSQELLAELNATSDPCEQTIFWRDHYQEIMLAQRREVRARYEAEAEGKERFLGMILPKQKDTR